MPRRYLMLEPPVEDSDVIRWLEGGEQNGWQFVGFHPRGKAIFQRREAQAITGTTACRNCTHYRRSDRTLSKDSNIWYDQYCVAVPPQRVFDPIAGEIRDDDHPRHCREINTGERDCPYFQERGAHGAGAADA